MTNDSLNVQVHHGKGDVTVIEAIGELDLNSAQILRPALLDAVTHGTVILDAAGLIFCDSSGLRTLAEARQAARTAGAVFRLAAPSSPLLRVLELAGALVVFEVYPDVETALKD